MVKRVSPVTLNPQNVRTHYSYFIWCKCQKCEQDFRRENGVKWTQEGYSDWSTLYLCEHCSHRGSVDWAITYIAWLEEMRIYNLKKQRPPSTR